MATIVTHSEHYSAIADAIRGKTGSEATLLPSEMAEAIANISTGGGTDTLKIVLDQKRDAEGLFRYYSEYADDLAQNFDFLNYNTTENVLNMDSAFGGQSLFTSLKAIETRNVQSFRGCFWSCSALETITSLDLRSATENNALKWMFDECYNLRTVNLLNIKQDLELRHAYYLQNVSSIIQNLVDVGSTRILCVNSNVQVSEEDIAIASDKGWTVSIGGYIWG